MPDGMTLIMTTKFNMPRISSISIGIMSAALLLLLMSAARFTRADGTELPVIGVQGSSVRLRCDLRMSSPASVRWGDLVHNSDPNPINIFASDRNPPLNLNHPNLANMAVGPDFTLTISKLELEDSPGLYFCNSTVDGQSYSKRFRLTVISGEKPACSSEVTTLREGESTTLVCSMEFSGSRVLLDWYRETELVPSNDRDNVRLANKTVDLTDVTYREDQKVYTCRMTFNNDVISECSLTMSVLHLVRDLKFSPDTTTMKVGDELRCSASGNPRPVIALDPASAAHASGPGWRSIVMKQDWVGRHVIASCSAMNELDGKEQTVAGTVNITVTARPNPASGTSSGNMIGIVVGLVIALVILIIIIVVVILVRRRKSTKKPPKGAKPLPTKDEISHGGVNGQNGQRGQAV